MADCAIRSSKEIETEKARLIGEAEQLQTRSRTEQLTPEQETELESALTRAEQLDTELVKAYREERLAVQRERMAQPTRPAPVPTNYHISNGAKADMNAEGIKLFLQSMFPEGDRSSGAVMRARTAGYDMFSDKAVIPVDWRKLNHRYRTYLSKGGANTGADLVPVTYESQVVEYLAHQSPLLNFLNVETVPNGDDRKIFRVDDTALEAAYTTASSGTEVAPTIPESNIATAAVTIKYHDITSGYQIVTFNELRDAAVDVESYVVQASANMFARKIEREVINAAAAGTSAIGGLLLSGSQSGSDVELGDVTMTTIESMYYDIPSQYRRDLVWVTSPTGEQKLRTLFKDTTGRSLFTQNAADPIGIERMLGFPLINSAYMPAWSAGNKCLMLVHAPHYRFRVVQGQTLQKLTEKYFPAVAWAGIMSIGAMWVGPTSTCRHLKVVADS